MQNKPSLIAFMNSYSQGKAGGDMVFIEIAKRLRNYNKVVVTSLLGKKLCQENNLKGQYLITTHESEFKNVIVTYIKRIVRVFFLKIKIEKEDIFLGTSDFLPDVLPIFWFNLRNKETKWAQHIFHLIPSSRKIPFLAQRISLELIKRFADLVVVDNSLLKGDLVRLGFDKEKIFVNYPGINLDYLRKIKAKKSDAYDGIFMAQLRQAKGVFDLIKIWELVCKEKPRVKLGIIGKGREEIMDNLQTEIEEVGLRNNIDLLGYLLNDKAFTLIKSSKVFIFPSHEEGFGIAPLEAQALGLPVVAWDLPVFAEIFKQGMAKIKQGDITKLAHQVIQLLTNKLHYQKLARDAIANANKYSWEKTARRELELLQKLS